MRLFYSVLCIKRFFIRDMTYNHVSDKDMFMSFQKPYVYDLSILMLLLISTNMMFKENNGNAIIVKWYANYEFQFDV